MAICKDCVHDNLCDIKQRYNHPKYALQHIEKYCEHFKDRLRLVYLPCKIGDTVYIYDPDLIYNPSVVEKAKVLLIQIHSKDNIRIFLCDEHCDKFWITLDTFIKGVKFNKEEAEQALNKTGDVNA